MSTAAFIITLSIISICACLVNVGLGLLHRNRAWVLPVRMLAGAISLAPLLAFILSQTFSLHLLTKLGINSTAYAFIALGVFVALVLMLPSWVDRRPKEADGEKGQKVGAGKGRVRVINGSDEWVN
ncbi:MAG TPA: hypothetical protein VKT82_34990 [Ktedonobacterales bacterium]|nr:hypothetical protein [Ktedonobacterales bacterium]